MKDPTPSRWDDAQLMAWADGHLPADEAAALEADLTRDAALAQRAALMQPTRAWTREAFDERLAEAPVPEALREQVQALVAQDRARRAAAAAPDQDARSRPPAPGRPGWLAALERWFSGFALPGAVAASVVFGGLGFVVGQSTKSPEGTGVALVAGAEAPAPVAALLDDLPSGEQGLVEGRALSMVASFRDGQGRLCRDFALSGEGDGEVEAVACRAAQGRWQLDYAARAPADTGYTPAAPSSALDAYLAAIGAGELLDAVAEREALSRR